MDRLCDLMGLLAEHGSDEKPCLFVSGKSYYSLVRELHKIERNPNGSSSDRNCFKIDYITPNGTITIYNKDELHRLTNVINRILE